MRYDVVIIGAGAAGFACALTLGSANDKFDWAKDKKYLILDDNKSDLNVGKYLNVAGVDSGINGVDLLLKMKKHNIKLIIRDGTSHNIPLEFPELFANSIKKWMKE